MRRLTNGGSFGRAPRRGKTVRLWVKHTNTKVPLPIPDGNHGVRFNALTLAVFNAFSATNPNLGVFAAVKTWSRERFSNANTPGLFHFDEGEGATSFANSGTASGVTGTCGGSAIITNKVTYTGGDNSQMTGRGALKIPGSASSNAVISADSGFSFGTAPFTIEFSWRGLPASSGSVGRYIFSDNSSTATAGNFSIRMNVAASDGAFDVYNQTTSLSAAGGDNGSHAAGAVEHFALVRNGTNVYFYVSGAQVMAVTVSAGMVFGSGNGFVIGTNNVGGGNGAQGLFDELVVTKGVAKYLASYQTPQPLTPDLVQYFDVSNTADAGSKIATVTPPGITLTAPTATASVGSSPDGTATITGASATSGAGPLVGAGGSAKALTGVGVVSGVGTVSASGTANVSAPLTGASSATGAGTIASGGNAAVAVVGTGAAGGVGDFTESGTAGVTLAGAGSATGTGTLAGAGTGNASAGGVEATSGAGAITAVGLAGGIATLSGTASVTSFGSIAAVGSASMVLPGTSATSGVGTLTETGTASKTLTGTGATSGVGAIAARGDAVKALTGVSSTSGIGTLTGSSSVAKTLTGVSATAGIGSVVSNGTATAAVAGAQTTGSVGTIVASASAVANGTANLTSTSATASAGNITASGVANVSATLTGTAATAGIGTIAGSGTGIGSAAMIGISGASGLGTVVATGGGSAAPAGASVVSAGGAISGKGDARVTLVGASATSGVGTLTVAAVSFANLVGVQTVSGANAPSGKGNALAVVIGVPVYSAAGLIGISSSKVAPQRTYTAMPELRAYTVYGKPKLTLSAEVRRFVVPAASKTIV